MKGQDFRHCVPTPAARPTHARAEWLLRGWPAPTGPHRAAATQRGPARTREGAEDSEPLRKQVGGAGATGGAPGALKTPAVTPTPRFPQSQLKYRQFAERLTEDTQIRYHIFVLSSTKSHLFLCLTPDIKQTVILKSGASLWMTSPTFKKMNDLFKRMIQKSNFILVVQAKDLKIKG